MEWERKNKTGTETKKQKNREKRQGIVLVQAGHKVKLSCSPSTLADAPSAAEGSADTLKDSLPIHSLRYA